MRDPGTESRGRQITWAVMTILGIFIWIPFVVILALWAFTDYEIPPLLADVVTGAAMTHYFGASFLDLWTEEPHQSRRWKVAMTVVFGLVLLLILRRLAFGG